MAHETAAASLVQAMGRYITCPCEATGWPVTHGTPRPHTGTLCTTHTTRGTTYAPYPNRRRPAHGQHVEVGPDPARRLRTRHHARHAAVHAAEGTADRRAGHGQPGVAGRSRRHP